MSTVIEQITELEEQLRQAELGPDADFFEKILADDAVMVSEGKPSFAKSQVVEAHRPGKGPKFTNVEMTNMQIIDHGTAAVVTCDGMYETPMGKHTLRFMRVWLKKDAGWQIVAGSIA
jgi:uncharacterized protein (TIGR02246 family)